jgi:cytochrome c-type biogenesis protein
VPFVLAGLGINKAYGAFGWFKRHFTVITVISGLLLALFGVLMISGRLIDLNIWFQRVLPEWLWSV